MIEMAHMESAPREAMSLSLSSWRALCSDDLTICESNQKACSSSIFSDRKNLPSSFLEIIFGDLSFNNFTSDLPSSFIALTNISTLHVQNNQLTGSLNVLANLPLTDLNVANNHFSGWIPRELISIPRFIYDGNSFDNGPAPPSPPYTSPPPGRPHNNRSHSPPGADS
ncbi:Protein STRUBBELIG-RECEPTOR FAMILY 8 [Camellia lanceoleosa]|uniref:Protein STRUBBELIG-RECEPTOR FAMILY 8 n=1 Tax=Camellia lanceoleosa TaxID=1840588 RepID=A0ACC0IZP9_9ERIC|nr:Protein STRUBBELIG-RECEPTOR FAMILY 8 [Camellia lanceoleosa]